jgi:2-methylfumaryl-CoA isomerase
VAEVLQAGADRPRSGNNLFGAFGRDFLSADGVRVMLVAITPKQWNGLVSALGIDAEMTALEAEIGTSLAKDEGARFTHRARVDPVFEAAIARFPFDKLGSMFDEAGCTWSVYRTLHEALSTEPRLFGENPIFSDVIHAGGAAYPTPGAPARIPGEERAAPAPSPRIGQHTDELLAELLGMDSGAIGKLHDDGLVA